MKVLVLKMKAEKTNSIDEGEELYITSRDIFDEDLAEYIERELNKNILVHSISAWFEKETESVNFFAYFSVNPEIKLDTQVDLISSYVYGQAIDGWGENGFASDDGEEYEFKLEKPEVVLVRDASEKEAVEIYDKYVDRQKKVDELNKQIKESISRLNEILDRIDI